MSITVGFLPIETHSDETASFARAIETSNVRVVARFTVLGEPISKARARFTNYRSPSRAYTPEKTKKGEEAVAREFCKAAPDHKPSSTLEYGLACVFFAGTKQRRDVDNMLKLVSDALNGVAWADDVQVREVMGRRGLDAPENARTEVLVYEVGERQYLTTPCQQCGIDIRTYSSWDGKRKYCSPECRNEARRECRRATCKACGKTFYLPQKGHEKQTCSEACRRGLDKASLICAQCGVSFQTPKSWAPSEAAAPLCSHECQVAYWAERRTTNRKGTCIDCGGPVSRREYQRCRSCSIRHRGPRVRNLTTFEETQP